jgi:hypothetical protein
VELAITSSGDFGLVTPETGDDVSRGTPLETLPNRMKNAPWIRTIGRSDVWISAIVNIEHKSICTFDQDGSVGLLGRLDEGNSINDIWSKVLAVFLRRKNQNCAKDSFAHNTPCISRFPPPHHT